MFTQKKKEYYSKILGFKTIEDFEEFSKRYLVTPEKPNKVLIQGLWNYFLAIISTIL